MITYGFYLFRAGLDIEWSFEGIKLMGSGEHAFLIGIVIIKDMFESLLTSARTVRGLLSSQKKLDCDKCSL